MRFDGSALSASRDIVWHALHDAEVLRELVTGCESMTPLSDGTYAATMVARVGPMTDTYRGTFTIDDLREGQGCASRSGTGQVRPARPRSSRVARRRARPGSTTLAYVAEATVGGLVSRMAGAALRVAGNHFTGASSVGSTASRPRPRGSSSRPRSSALPAASRRRRTGSPPGRSTSSISNIRAALSALACSR